MDRNELLNAIDAREVLDKLGVVFRRPDSDDVLCPFHGDRHFGSAKMRNEGSYKGIYCYACGKYYSVYDVAGLKENGSIPESGQEFIQALNKVADICGYSATGNEKKAKVPAMQYLGFPDADIPTGAIKMALKKKACALKNTFVPAEDYNSIYRKLNTIYLNLMPHDVK